MKKRTGIFAIIIAIIALGVGYAAITSVDLNVNSSTATMTPDSENFKVVFKDAATFSKTGDGSIIYTRDDDHNVTFTLTGFSRQGDSAVITLPFKNDSETLKAALEDAAITNSNSEYFSVTANTLSGTVLAKKGESGSESSLIITVEAIKTPIENEVSTTITAKVTASPQND